MEYFSSLLGVDAAEFSHLRGGAVANDRPQKGAEVPLVPEEQLQGHLLLLPPIRNRTRNV
jgi:hypothetical protein